MIVKGFLKICAGIFSGNRLTFEDADVSPKVTLLNLLEFGFPYCEFSCGFMPFEENNFNVICSGEIQELENKSVCLDCGEL